MTEECFPSEETYKTNNLLNPKPRHLNINYIQSRIVNTDQDSDIKCEPSYILKQGKWFTYRIPIIKFKNYKPHGINQLLPCQCDYLCFMLTNTYKGIPASFIRYINHKWKERELIQLIAASLYLIIQTKITVSYNSSSNMDHNKIFWAIFFIQHSG